MPFCFACRRAAAAENCKLGPQRHNALTLAQVPPKPRSLVYLFVIIICNQSKGFFIAKAVYDKNGTKWYLMLSSEIVDFIEHQLKCLCGSKPAIVGLILVSRFSISILTKLTGNHPRPSFSANSS